MKNIYHKDSLLYAFPYLISESNRTIKMKLTLVLALAYISFISSCTKAININQPTNSLTTSEVFADGNDATAAINGIYAQLINSSGDPQFGNGLITQWCGESADELLPFESGGDLFFTNSLLRNSASNDLWIVAYPLIYQCNSVIEGVASSNGINAGTKQELTGEAKFLRAFFNFYLTNLYGNIPIVTTTNYQTNQSLPQTSVNGVYQTIVADLKDAQNDLPSDYSAGAGERVKANKWAATALLSRVYLYTQDWKDAEIQASALISNTALFSLEPNLNNVFLANSSETILQWAINSNKNPIGNATTEGFNFIPYPNSPPNYYLTTQLLNSFEPGDLRRTTWVGTDSVNYAGTTYYYPFKYTVRYGAIGATVSQYYTVLRLAEQYLIRAEAEANGAGNGLSGAINDLNVIRNRSGLSNTTANDKTTLLAAVAQERRVELFAEWGHRWFDLKRTGMAHNVLSILPYKQPWKGDYQFLYPIPIAELTYDPNLKENPGY